jgi:hypothetical protein
LAALSCACGGGSSSSSSGGAGSASNATTGNGAGTTGNTTGITRSTTEGAGAGSGPKNQGIGGTSDAGDAGVINHNTNTVPPGFNKNGDRGTATSTNGNTP